MKSWMKKTLAVVAAVGLLNWGVIGLTKWLNGSGFNFVEAILPWTLLVNVVYVIAGVAGGFELAKLFK